MKEASTNQPEAGYPFDNLIVFANPNSTDAHTEGDHLTGLLKEHYGDWVQVIPTKPRLEDMRLLIIDALTTALARGKKPIACFRGGDGTMNMAVQTLCSASTPAVLRKIPLLHIPAGNANDLAHMANQNAHDILTILTCGTPVDVYPLEAIIERPHSIPERRVSINYISLGATARAAGRLNGDDIRNEQKKRPRLGKLKASALALHTALHKGKPVLYGRGGDTHKAHDIIVSNGPRMAKHGKLRARLEQAQEMQVSIIPHTPIGRAIRYAGAILLATGLLWGKVRQGESFDFIALSDMPAQFDGEVTHITSGSYVSIHHTDCAVKLLSTSLAG